MALIEKQTQSLESVQQAFWCTITEGKTAIERTGHSKYQRVRIDI